MQLCLRIEVKFCLKSTKTIYNLIQLFSFKLVIFVRCKTQLEKREHDGNKIIVKYIKHKDELSQKSKISDRIQ